MILDRITIADRRTAKHLLRDHPTLSVLAVGERDPSLWGSTGQVVRMPLVDGERIDGGAFWAAVEELSKMLRKQDHILICCHAGESRSVAVPAGLLLRDHTDLLDAVDLQTALRETHPLFLAHHRWFTERDEQQHREIPVELLRHPEVHRLFAAYVLLGRRWERSHLNVGLWKSVLTAFTRNCRTR